MGVKIKILIVGYLLSIFNIYAVEYQNPEKIVSAEWGKERGEVYVDYSGDMGLEGIDLPSKFVFDAKNNIYISDPGNQKVIKFDSKGKFISEYSIDSIKVTPNESFNIFKTYKVNRKPDEGIWSIEDTLDKSVISFKSEKQFSYLKQIGMDLYMNTYLRDFKSETKKITPTNKEKEDWIIEKRKEIYKSRDIIKTIDRWGNNLGMIIGPLTTITTIIIEPASGRVRPEQEFDEYYKQIETDPYGNIYIQGLKPSEYFILKYSKIHYIPVLVAKMSAKKTPGSVYNVAEYTSAPQGKIKESGFKLLKDGKEIYKLETSGLSTVKYLGKDKLGQYWVYYESPRKKKVDKKYIVDGNNKDWFIMKKERGRFFKKGIWYTVLCSINLRMLSKSIPGIINENMIDFDKVKVGSDGNLYYKDKGKWYRQENIQQMDFTATDVQSFAGIEKDIKVEPYTNYEDVAPIELERGIEIKKGNESIRKFKYYSQDTLYTVKNLGLDDKNNIYVYVNWFDWLTKDKMKEVVKFNTKGEFQNRINLTKEETPVLGLDGFVYTHENEGAEGIVRKYEGKTLP